jgi:hypothetical protein
MLEGTAAADAAKELVAKLHPPVRALGVDLTPTTLAIQVQDPAIPGHIDSYTYVLAKGLAGSFGVSGIKGPDPVPLNLINSSLEENLFDLAEIDFAAVPAAIRAAIERAKLDDPATVSGIRIRRHLDLLPTARSGAVEWTLAVQSDRESAEAYADAKGKFQRVNLSGTRRAATLDYRKGGEPLAEAIARMREVFGEGRFLNRVEVDRQDITFSARAAGQPPDQALGYSCQINGVSRTLGPTVVIPGQEPKEDDYFALSEVDWLQLPKLSDQAVEKAALPGGRVSKIEVERFKIHFATRPVQWRFSVKAGGADPFLSSRSDEGTAIFLGDGSFVRVELPKSRQPAKDFYLAETIRSLLPEFRQNFGPQARFEEMTFDERGVRISAFAPTPAQPGHLQSLWYDLDHFYESPIDLESPLEKGFTADWLFTLDDVEKSVLPKLEALKTKTLALLKLPDGKFERIALHRHSPFYPENRRLQIEIRATGSGGNGYVVYDDGGGVVDVIAP